MGNSLHNKIPLGRVSVFDSRPLQAAMLVSICLSIGLIYLFLDQLR